jgi:hypothetical protein
MLARECTRIDANSDLCKVLKWSRDRPVAEIASNAERVRFAAFVGGALRPDNRVFVQSLEPRMDANRRESQSPPADRADHADNPRQLRRRAGEWFASPIFRFEQEVRKDREAFSTFPAFLFNQP